MATVTALLTVEEFAILPDADKRLELAFGRIIEMPPPSSRHGLFASRFNFLLRFHVMNNQLGEVLSESGVITHRNPDSIRCPDGSFYRATKLPPVDQWDVYIPVPPDLVLEVRSPGDRWPELIQKAAEYLAAGVLVVVVLDPTPRTAFVFATDQAPQSFGPDEMLTFPDLLPGFAVRVGSIFE